MLRQLMTRTHLLLYIYAKTISTFRTLDRREEITNSNTAPLHESFGEGYGDIPQLSLQLLAKSTFPVDLGEKLRLVRAEVSQEVSLPSKDLVDRDVVKKTVDTSEDEGHHLVHGHGRVLLLLQELGETFTTVEGLLGSSIQIRTELGEGGNLTVLSQEELQGTSNLLHSLKLGSGTDTRHGQTDVDGRSDTLVEQLSLQEDLAVSDGNDVSGNVGRHITTLGLNDGEGSQRTATVLIVHLGSTLQETRVEVEDARMMLEKNKCTIDHQ